VAILVAVIGAIATIAAALLAIAPDLLDSSTNTSANKSEAADTSSSSSNLDGNSVANNAQKDTEPGTILEVGQTWWQSGMALTLADIVLFPDRTEDDCKIGLAFEIYNMTSSNIIVSYAGVQFSLKDNLNQLWPRTGISENTSCPWYESPYSVEIPPSSRYPDEGNFYINVGFEGNLADTSIDSLVVTVDGLSHFQQARWSIPINH